MLLSPRMVVSHFLMGGPNSLCGQSRERGGNLSPYDDICSRFQIKNPDQDSRSGHFSFHVLKGEAGYPGLGLPLSPFLATGGP